jgi:hypothetical protein
MAHPENSDLLTTVVQLLTERNRPAHLSITHKFQPSKIQKILKN